MHRTRGPVGHEDIEGDREEVESTRWQAPSRVERETHYYPNEPEDVVYAHFRAVADATDIPIMIYNNPPATGQDLSVGLLRRLAEIDQIVALKECTGRTDKLREVAFYLADRFAILPCLTPRTMPFG